MSKIELQQLMIIKKTGRQLHWSIKLKHIIIILLTWILWGYIASFVIIFSQGVFYKPVLESLMFYEVILFMLLGVLLLTLITILWASLTKIPKSIYSHK